MDRGKIPGETLEEPMEIHSGVDLHAVDGAETLVAVDPFAGAAVDAFRRGDQPPKRAVRLFQIRPRIRAEFAAPPRPRRRPREIPGSDRRARSTSRARRSDGGR